ncbi:MAG: hypothetical protein FJZ01_23960 [Candidatus Sericytochromatia bacterium]|nr:hypothetical protein [Candidatus Tanganyikabacteria bacterium]
MRKLLSTLAAASLVAACAVSPLRAGTARPAAPSDMGAVDPPAGAAPANPAEEALGTGQPAHADPGGTGEILVAIRWPGYQAQALPASAATVDITVSTGSTQIASLPIGRPTATGSISKVPEGAYWVKAQAWRYASATNKTKTTVAEATASVAVKANRRSQAALTLALKYPPALTGLTITPDCPDYRLTGAGTNLKPFVDVSPKVLLGGQIVTNLEDYGNTSFEFVLPAGTPATASVALEVDGIGVATVSKAYDKVALIKFATDSVTVARNATAALAATAFEDAAGTATAGARVRWDIVPGGTLAAGTHYSFGDTGRFDALDTAGTAWIKAYAGCGSATLSVRVP